MNLYPNLGQERLISIDVETKDPTIKTTRLSAYDGTGYIVGFSVGTSGGFKKYYPLKHPGEGNLPLEPTVAWLKDQMKNDVPKVGANILYDLEWLALNLGVRVNGKKICVQVTEALIDENRLHYSLDSLSRDYLNKTKDEDAMRAAAERLGIKPDEVKANIWRLPAADVIAYGEADATLPIEIFLEQEKKLEAQGLWSVFELECDLHEVLLGMRLNGVRVDMDRAHKLVTTFDEHVKKARVVIKKVAGREVDIWSGTDIEKAAKGLGLAYPVTEKNNPSFKSDWLEQQTDPFFKAVREARKWDRANETFVKAKILDLSYKGRIYPQYFSTRNERYGTVTGRFSSANPNMQQIPARDPEIGKMIRSIFLPEEGQEWEVYDFSQQEPRVTVHYAYLCGLPGAEKAKQAYIDDPNTDYHQMVAEMVNCIRKHAKTINLGLAYGMGKTKLAEQLGMTMAEAAPLFDQYHAALPYARQLSERCTRLAERRGYIRTVSGRRRHFESWGPYRAEKGTKPLPYEEALQVYGKGIKRWFTHKSMNNLIQGSSADMIKMAMVLIYRELKIIPLVTIHDELGFSNSNRGLSKKIKELMLTCVKLEVPLKLDYERGPSWGECKEMDL